ncbi:MAG: tetratricopeptide repeat-containing sulfotransferase family protein [Hyphomonas sp.]
MNTQPHPTLARVDALVAAGDTVSAIAHLKTALAADPRFFAGWIRLGNLLYSEESYADAISAVQEAEQCDPLQAEFRSIQASMQRRDFAQAERTAKHMLDKAPGHPRAVFTLAHLAQARGDDEGRIAALQSGLSQSPANLFLRTQLLTAYEETGAYRAAIETARHIAEIEESFESLRALADILFRFGQHGEALEACDRADRFCGDEPAKRSQLDIVRGQIYRILGERGKSEASLRSSLAGDAQNAAAWWALADFKTYRFSDGDRRAMRDLVNSPQASPDQKSMAAFALAKASESEGDWDAAMSLYRTANELKPGPRHDLQRFSGAIDRIISAFTPVTLALQAGDQIDGPVPIFIVGLPRSGSTLIEQILASHTQIEGTHELPALPGIKRKAHSLCVTRFGGDYLSNVGRLPAADLSSLGQAYISEGGLFRSGNSRFFTDKMPFNFEHVGLIHKVLPKAVIVDAGRNPLDCGFSLYKQYFSAGSSFSYSLEAIGDYYRGYLRLMDHWDTVLPGKVLHVQYEELVRAPEQQIRRLLEHVGVAYEEGCAEFHKTRRPVRTASSEQVRRPMYADSIGAWRNVESHLEGLKAALGPDVLKRFERYLGPT